MTLQKRSAKRKGAKFAIQKTGRSRFFIQKEVESLFDYFFGWRSDFRDILFSVTENKEEEMNMRSKFLIAAKSIAILLSPVLLLSCATIIGKSGPESLNIRSTPDQANIVITDESGVKIFEGKTPTLLSLQKKKGYFSGKKYNITITKEGFKDHIVTVDTEVNGWYLGGNILFGGLIGWLIVDPATGAMWTLDTDDINVTLETSQHTSVIQPDTAVLLLQDIPASLRHKMVKVSQ